MTEGENIRKIQKCLMVRNGIDIWIDEDKSNAIKIDMLKNFDNNFIEVEGNMINIKDIIGIFSNSLVIDLERRKAGNSRDEKEILNL